MIAFPHPSRQHPLHYVPVNVREAIAPALMFERQPFVVQAEQVEHGGLKIVDMDLVLDGVEPEFVRSAVAEAYVHSGAAVNVTDRGTPTAASATGALSTLRRKARNGTERSGRVERKPVHSGSSPRTHQMRQMKVTL